MGPSRMAPNSLELYGSKARGIGTGQPNFSHVKARKPDCGQV
ncbi:uncharacterized protein G2W53_034741 [Senna tora]|uniref:Uncharacterized protein n=1 Tax=Senna tora TaxID=362788 RepID=A0A834T356_9FABA|nr:uncharacterized protein G2W53_034741 [Senna tora]